MTGLIYYVMSLSVCQELGNLTSLVPFVSETTTHPVCQASIGILYPQRFTWCRCESDFQRLQTSQ